MSYFKRLLSQGRRGLVILGLVALAVALVGAYVGAIKLLVDTRVGDGGSAQQGADVVQEGEAPPPAPEFPGSDYAQNRFPRVDGRPLLGVNYTHHGFRDCSFNGTGILRTYSNPGIARKVHTQLYQMRQAGIAAIRTIIWHISDASTQSWGPVSSAGGQIAEPYRTNLIRYLTELRRFGFARLTISFGPLQDQDPLRLMYNPRTFDENWRFIVTIRSLVKRYGPRDTRIDLMNEGTPSEAPSDWSPLPQQTGRYLSRMYRLYVTRFGNRDVTISTIAWDPTDRMRNLVRLLKSTGQPMPRWYDVHIGYNSAQASYALENTDKVLDTSGIQVPLVVGETAYGNRGIARVIANYPPSASRRIDEVSPWYVRRQRGCQVPPPYRPGVYRTEIRER